MLVGAEDMTEPSPKELPLSHTLSRMAPGLRTRFFRMPGMRLDREGGLGYLGQGSSSVSQDHSPPSQLDIQVWLLYVIS